MTLITTLYYYTIPYSVRSPTFDTVRSFYMLCHANGVLFCALFFSLSSVRFRVPAESWEKQNHTRIKWFWIRPFFLLSTNWTKYPHSAFISQMKCEGRHSEFNFNERNMQWNLNWTFINFTWYSLETGVSSMVMIKNFIQCTVHTHTHTHSHHQHYYRLIVARCAQHSCKSNADDLYMKKWPSWKLHKRNMERMALVSMQL